VEADRKGVGRCEQRGNANNPSLPDSFDESALVTLALQGDETAFARLVEPCYRKVYCSALEITRNHEDAEDACQECLLKAFSHLDQFQGNSRFSTWLTRIVINEALMKIRKRRAEDAHLFHEAAQDQKPSSFENFCAGDSSDPAIVFVAREKQRILREAVAGLRKKSRVAVWLLGLQEWKTKEAARILNVSESALKSRFMHARRELRECLADRI
jgi:RNA polymerase sigma-70 factor (ECF subfamily)